MISSERYSVGSEDGRSISFQKEEGAFVGLDVTIKFKYVIVVIICAVAIMGGTSYYSSVYPEQNVAEVQDTVTQNEMQSPVDDEGFVFAKSSSEVLSEEMVLALSNDETVGFQRLLRMSINEIYARHGQMFNAGEVNDIHYQKYNWYRETNKHVVEWDEFNDIEKAKEVLQLISNKDCVIELLENSGDISIKIGEENYIPEAKDCSVITAEYFLGGRPIGSVGLIGPQRINYSKVVTIMSQVMKELNKSLKDQEY